MPSVQLLVALGWGLLAASLLMALVFLLARALDNYAIVDVAWAASFTAIVGIYLALGAPPSTRSWIVAAMVVTWSLRLAFYLGRRVAALHPVEDARYQDLRASWKGRLGTRFFTFFQVQAVAAVAFSLPHALVVVAPPAPLGLPEYAGLALWGMGLAGESLADAQLARFKGNPANRGRVCQAGLWHYSRHPNYFFEWLVWCGFGVFALGAPGGWLGLAAPALMLYTLLRVTGIPATEDAAVTRRGDAYREYQRTTSAFVPWFPRTLNASDRPAPAKSR